MRAELAKEHVDFDACARRDELKLRGEQAALATREEAGEKGGRRHKAIDNVKSFGGNNAAYLVARLKCDHPDIAAQLAKG